LAKRKATEPSVIYTLSTADLEESVASECVPTLHFPQFPCHTQSVERSVQLVDEASAALVGQTSENGSILARLDSRELIPSLYTKAEFQSEFNQQNKINEH